MPKPSKTATKKTAARNRGTQHEILRVLGWSRMTQTERDQLKTWLRQALRAMVVAGLLLGPLARTSSGQPIAIDHWLPQFPTEGARKAADIASWGTVLSALALDSVESWKGHCSETWFTTTAPIGEPSPRGRCFLKQGVRLGLNYAAASIVKKLVGRDRPCVTNPESCGSSTPDASFYSLHAAMGWSTVGGPRLAVAIPLAASTAGLRPLAGQHWLSDALVGSFAGLLTSRIR